ncbi:hypothetical protein AVEN_94046-1 [Araneus ventricosus]|uniref:Reverse transcriptase domain-containing protein n=1 Tax=Araneus ventricosus TaxID=182803 RepID=A0A4Y2HUI0_ARAVE|nr:hypothetical protein AVEN_94046-1 [Araneus ventricosus]
MKYISSITSATSSAQLWKKVKAASGIYKEFSFPVMRRGTTLYSPPIEVANIIGQDFSRVSSADSYSPTFLVTKRRAKQVPLNFKTRKLLPYNCAFRMFELKKSSSEVKDTSPGPDGIRYSMIRHLDADSLANLLSFFNRIWKEQVYSSQWREAIVIPILKPEKYSSNPLNYRRIALTSCLSKPF